jgi:hypothetical protein
MAESQGSLPRAVFHGVPSYFRCCCITARQGGRFSYAIAGAQLTHNLASHCPYDATEEQWAGATTALERLLQDGRFAEALSWFDQHCPGCMKVVPRRGRAAFLRGVIETFEREGIG